MSRSILLSALQVALAAGCAGCRLRWLQVALAVLLVGSSAVAGWWQCWAASRSTAAVLSCSERESREQRAESREESYS